MSDLIQKAPVPEHITRRVSCQSYSVPDTGVSKTDRDHGSPRGTLLPLGLFLCLGLLLSSAGSESSRDNCIFFDEVYTYGSGPDIRVNSNIYESNKIYTVMIPGTKSNSSVILRAVDQSNNPVGLWQEAYQQCNDSALYHMKNLVDIPFMANWSSPDSLDIAAVEIQAITIHPDSPGVFSSLTLSKIAMTTTSTSKTSMTNPTQTSIRTSTAGSTTDSATTTATTQSLGNRVYSSPIIDAIHILLVFLISKLIF